MSERFDFSSISRIILKNKKANTLTNAEYYFTLFDYAFSQVEIKVHEPDEADISKTINGQRNIIQNILHIYGLSENYKHLENGVSNILQNIIDHAYVKEELANLIWNDIDISPTIKEKLTEDKLSLTHFVTDCFLFAFSRDFIRREKKGSKYITKERFLLSDYLLDYHFPSINKVFYGRESDLLEIHKQLCNESSLFLEGIGGIGKSELAKQYGKCFKKEYDHIIFMRYTESLRRTIIELDFVNDSQKMTEDELFRNHYRFFKRLTSNTLIILDNFDTVPENDDLFHDFLSFPFRLLVTTRSHIEEAPCYLVEEIEDMNELSEIFYTYAPISRNKPSVVTNIIEEVYCHTLTVEMAAKTLTASDLAPETLLSALRQERLALSNPNKVSITKDSKTKKERLHGHIQTLFQLQNLSERNRFTLLHTVLIPDKGISKGLFHKWMGTMDFNSINELIDYGWIQQDNETSRISLHPILHEVIADYNQPSFSKCDKFLESLHQEYMVDNIDMSCYRDLSNTIKSVFKNIKIDDCNSAFHLMEKVLTYMEKHAYYDSLSWLLDIMEVSIPIGKERKMETATYELYRGYVACARNDLSTAKKHYWKGIDILQPIDHTNEELVIKLYNHLTTYYLRIEDRENFLKYASIVLELKKKCNPDDCLQEQLMLVIAYGLNDDEENAEGLLVPLMSQAIEMANSSISKEELQGYLELIVPEELPEELGNQYQKVTEALNTFIAPVQNSITLLDIVAEVLDTVAYL